MHERGRRAYPHRDILLHVGLVDDFFPREFWRYGRAVDVGKYRHPSDRALRFEGSLSEFRSEGVLQLPHAILGLAKGTALEGFGRCRIVLSGIPDAVLVGDPAAFDLD